MDAVELALIGAITNDEKSKQRIQALIDQMNASQEAETRAREAQEHADATLAEAKEHRLRAEAISADAAQRHTDLDALEVARADSIQAFNAEKIEFEKVRANVEAQQMAKSDELQKMSDGLDSRMKVVMEREAVLDGKERAADDLLASLTAKHDAMRKAMAAE